MPEMGEQQCMGNWHGNNWVHELCTVEGEHQPHLMLVEDDDDWA